MHIALVGEALIDFTGAGNMAFQGHCGGSPLNSAVACARLGQPTAYLTQLSTDLFGDQRNLGIRLLQKLKRILYASLIDNLRQAFAVS